MRIPDSIRRCTAFVGYRTAELGNKFAGTVFFVAEMSEGKVVGRWAVTATHIFEKFAPYTSEPETVLLRVNGAEQAEWRHFALARWIAHPDPARDVSVMRLDEGDLENTDALFFPTSSFIDDAAVARWNIGVGDETLITGLFQSHLATARNIPIVRTGFIAAMPEESVFTGAGQTPAYLVEARSIGGLSGSPAFLSYGPIRVHPESGRFQRLSRPEFGLLGLVHGHFSVDGARSDAAEPHADGLTVEDTNSGIAVVIPAPSVTEAIAFSRETQDGPATA